MLPKRRRHKMDLWKLPSQNILWIDRIFLGFIQISFYIPIFCIVRLVGQYGFECSYGFIVFPAKYRD